MNECKIEIETYNDRSEFVNILIRNGCTVRMDIISPAHSSGSDKYIIFFTLPKGND